MTEFKLDLSDFEEIVDCAKEAAEDIGMSVEYADDAESIHNTGESGEWADAWFSTFTANVQTVLNTLQEVTSAFAGYYSSALEDANSLATQRDNVMGAVGASASNADKIALTTGYHIPTKCSDAKTSIDTLRINAYSVIHSDAWEGSDAWSSLTNDSTYYYTDVSSYKTNISEYLNDLIDDAENQSDALANLSEYYSTFKAGVEEFEEYYSGCFDTQTIEDIVNGLTLENSLIYGTGIISDLKVINSWVSTISLALSFIPIPVVQEICAGIALVSSTVGKVLDATYIVAESAESWLTTDGDWQDKLSSTASTAAWESLSYAYKSAFKYGIESSFKGTSSQLCQSLVSHINREFFSCLSDAGVKEEQDAAVDTVVDWTVDTVEFVAEANYEVEAAEAEANYETSQQIWDWTTTFISDVGSFFSDLGSALTYSGD